MVDIGDEGFKDLIEEVMSELPHDHMAAVKNVAIVYADKPTSGQRAKLKLRDDESLFGLYEGVPLTKRQGVSNYPPDKITIFKQPIAQSVDSYVGLKDQVKHTLWHEIAHYFGLGHTEIRKLEDPRI